MDSIENISTFLGLDQRGKATLLAGRLGVPFSENLNELIHAIGATLAGDIKISPKKPDWKDVIQKCGDAGAHEFICCLANDDPTHCDNWPLRWAAQNGHLEVVRLLLADKRVDPSANNQYSLRAAAENGYIAVVRLLLQDPRVDVDVAIATAKKYGEHGISKTLAGLKKLKE